MLVHASLFNIVEPKIIIFCELSAAQAIQRQLEEVAEKQRDLEERGVTIEKAIRREAGAGNPCSHVTVLQIANVEQCIVCYSRLNTSAWDFITSFIFFYILLPDTFSFHSFPLGFGPSLLPSFVVSEFFFSPSPRIVRNWWHWGDPALSDLVQTRPGEEQIGPLWVWTHDLVSSHPWIKEWEAKHTTSRIVCISYRNWCWVWLILFIFSYKSLLIYFHLIR